MTMRFRGKAKEKRDKWIKRMALDNPNFTQKEIADKFGIHQSGVCRILKELDEEISIEAQRLYEQDGGINLYKASIRTIKDYEDKAIELLKGDKPHHLKYGEE